jgi:hypothetical protein
LRRAKPAHFTVHRKNLLVDQVMVEVTKSRNVVRVIGTAVGDMHDVMIASPPIFVAAFAVLPKMGATPLIAKIDHM